MLDTLFRRRHSRVSRASGHLLVAAAACACALAFARPAHATWPAANVNLAVNTSAGAQNYGATVSDGHGGMFVTWADYRFVVSDIYVQHVNSDGTLGWNPTGLITCAASGRQDQPVLCSDAAGGVIVAWRDFRTSIDGDIWAQHIDASGASLWGFNGIKICTASGAQSVPSIVLDPNTLFDGVRGAFIAWQDERNGARIYAQHVLPNGVTLWADDGIPVSSNLAAQFEPRLADDGVTGILVAWSQQNAVDYDVWVQHLDATGTGYWGTAGVRACGAAGDQFGARALIDGAGGAWVGWQDDRGSALAIYTQHFTPAGVPVQPTDGAPVCVTAKDQSAPAFAVDGGGGLFVTWIDSRTSSDVYAQHLDFWGAPVWSTSAISVSSGSGTHIFPSAAADGTGGVIIAWEDNRNGATDIYGQRLDAAGNAAWAVGGAGISTAASNQYEASVVSNGDGTAVVLWSDLRNGTVDLYAQRVPLDGTLAAQQVSRLLSSSPNPASAQATFAFELPAPGRGELTVYDAAGRHVRTVTQADFSAGDHRVAWDARDDAGRRVVEGVYFARLIMDHRVVATRTLAITR